MTDFNVFTDKALSITYTRHILYAVMREARNLIPHVFIYRVRLSGSLIPPTGVRPRKKFSGAGEFN